MYNIGNRWDNEEGWTFHKVLKRRITNFLIGKTDKIVIHNDEVKPDWYFGPTMEDYKAGATDPANIDFLKNMIEHFAVEVKEKRIKLPIKWKLWRPLANMLLSVYTQDSAWYERWGGLISFFVMQCDKLDNFELLRQCRAWYLKYEGREYGQAYVLGAFDMAIKEYPKGKFYTQCIDFFLNYLREHQKEWEISKRYNPASWYGYGRGQFDYLVMGREG